MLCIFNTFTRKYFHFAHVILTMLSSTYHFWGVHNLYQAKLANSILERKVKFFFLFSLFVFRYSFFVIPFHYSFFYFWFFALCFSFLFFTFRFSFFDIQNWAEYHILTFQLRPNVVFLHSKSYFDIQTGALYCIWHSKSYFEIKNRLNIVFWHSNWGRRVF